LIFISTLISVFGVQAANLPNYFIFG